MPTQVRFKKVRYSNGRPEWEITEHALLPLEEGQFRLQLRYISIDPGMMGWISAKRSYMPAVNEGEVMRAFGVGEVVDSRSDRFPVGSFATGIMWLHCIRRQFRHGFTPGANHRVAGNDRQTLAENFAEGDEYIYTADRTFN